ncbi:MAG: phytanoyl-CoA dioxygenase family protein [Sphingomonas sp.]|nr:phytanoyl-CoA dioxygenase family protein [Sphingomonas sp.]
MGAIRFGAVLDAKQVDRVARLFGDGRRPGKRLSCDDLRSIGDLIGTRGAIGRIATGLLGPGAKPVRALLLDKSEAANWRLGWHQDRTIAVQERVEVTGFGPWSVKAGQLHVQPPHEITTRMVTLRVHVDGVDHDNAPLSVLPGSHVKGRLDDDAVQAYARKQEALTCLAEAGDIWAYSTAIVHASPEQKRSGRRRVLQIDYSAEELLGGLKWAALLEL